MTKIFILCVFLLGMNQRNGTDVDAANALKAFSGLGYKVKIYNDQTMKQMEEVLIAGKYYSKCHCSKVP